MEEIYGGGRPLSGNLDSRHLVADFEREVKAGVGLVRAVGELKFGLAKRFSTPGERLDQSRAWTAGAAQHAGGQLAPFADGLSDRECGIILLGAEHHEASGFARE